MMQNQKGNVMMIILVLVVLMLIVGGAFYFYNLSQKHTPNTSTVQQPNTQTTATSKDNDLSNQLNSVQIENTDDSFSAVDQDLQSL